jgi:hypothetical protein
MKKAVGRLEEVKAGLLALSSSRNRQATGPQPPVEMTSVLPKPLRDLPAAALVRDNQVPAPIGPARDWRTSMLVDLALTPLVARRRPEESAGGRCLQPANNKRLLYKSTMTQVW